MKITEFCAMMSHSWV